MFKRIRTKLAVVLAIPLLILVGIAYLEVSGSLRQSHSVAAQTDLATVAIGPGSLVSSLQIERNQAGLHVLGFDSQVALSVANATEARARVNASASAFRASISARGAGSTKAYQAAFAALGRLHALRSQMDAFRGTTGVKTPETTTLAATLFDGYTGIIQAFFDANSRVAGNVDDAQLRTGIELLGVTLRQQEAESLAVKDAYFSTLTGGLSQSGRLPGYTAEVADFHNWTQQMSVLATGSYAAPVRGYTTGPGVSALNKTLDSYLNGTPIDLSALLTAGNSGAVPGQKAAAIPAEVLQIRLAALVKQQADHLRSAAQSRLLLFILLALLGAALGIGIVVIATRSITGPLRGLAKQADTMATTTLPTAVQSILDTAPGEDVAIPEVPPVTVPTRDEVGAVAAALNTVQNAALELAVEQAVLRRNIADSFVNLGRRNQNLLSRQLDFITALENKETEPGKLDDLFRLDHLATRMRRNAESLLVLAGLESPRQWSAPVAVGDIMRASLAEVEDYRRVSVRQVDPASLPGSAAADLAHIIAELVENAIASSPPETQVEVYGRSSARDYLISVVDRGVGMAAADLERANLRLAGGESFTVAPSRYLGHYVAGRLAARYGITVMLQDSDSGGIKARILLPAALLDQLSPQRIPSAPPAAVAPRVPAPAAAPTAAAPRTPPRPPLAPAPAPKPSPAPLKVAAPSSKTSGASSNAAALSPAPGAAPASAPMRAPAPAPLRAPAPVPAPVAGRGANVGANSNVRAAAQIPDGPALAGLAAPASPPLVKPALPSRVPIDDAPRAPISAAAQPVVDPNTTSGGLLRRVPGASITNDGDDLSLRRTVEDDGVGETGDTSAHEVYRMLSNLWTEKGTKTSSPASTEHSDHRRND